MTAVSLTLPTYPSALSLRGLADLFFRPTRYFRSADLGRGKAWVFAAWIVGIASAIDRIDTNLIRADLGLGSGSASLSVQLANSWPAFWAFVVPIGAIAAVLLWLIGGWWYNVRLRWSGAVGFDQREGRLVYAFSSLIHAIPALLYAVVATMLFPSYLSAFLSEELWSVALVVFPFWGALASYKGVRAKFQPKPTPARVWFLILPMLFYAVVVAAITFASQGSGDELDELAALRLSNPDSASRALEKYVASKPRDDMAWTILGHAYLDLDQDEKAAASYERALDVNPRRVEALTAMGVLRSRERRYDESMAFYEKALSIDPQYAQAYSSIAVIALKLGDDVKALNYARKAFALDSTDGVIASNLALAYHYNGMVPMRDHMTKVAERLGYDGMGALRGIYSGEASVRDP